MIQTTNPLENRLADKKIVAILCNQWGDSGKGKFIDYFVHFWNPDIIVRGTGGANAGHTIEFDGKKYITHIIPSGIIHKDKTNILGNGMAIDPYYLVTEEMRMLQHAGISLEGMMISKDARVVHDFELIDDILNNANQEKGNVGSTARGMAPCYEDKANKKISIEMKDLFNEDVLRSKLNLAREKYAGAIKEFESRRSKEFQKYSHIVTSVDDIIEKIKTYRDELRPFVADTTAYINEARLQGKKILIEGAQGFWLSVEYGTGKYATSSDCSINGTAAGSGLSAQVVDMVFGIVKFPYMTRVGGGPFPTELGGSTSENYCKNEENNLKHELAKYSIPFEEKPNGGLRYDHHHPKIIKLINSIDPFEKGVGIRFAGEEFGATTGRPRRTGWTDLEMLKYATMINGMNLILTKPDVLQGIDEFKLGMGYEQGNWLLDKIDLRNPHELSKAVPIYKTFKGFNEDISAVDRFEDLPFTLKDSIQFLEKYTRANARIISTGADRLSTIIR